jgi:hypothetical protein
MASCFAREGCTQPFIPSCAVRKLVYQKRSKDGLQGNVVKSFLPRMNLGTSFKWMRAGVSPYASVWRHCAIPAGTVKLQQVFPSWYALCHKLHNNYCCDYGGISAVIFQQPFLVNGIINSAWRNDKFVFKRVLFIFKVPPALRRY